MELYLLQELLALGLGMKYHLEEVSLLARLLAILPEQPGLH